ncbi:MAG: TrkA C-terminal domain-containing protein [Desulfovermiculus sp.]
MEEFKLSSGSAFQGKSLIESKLRPLYNLIIVAIKKQNEDMIYNPTAETELKMGDTLIVVGKKSDLEEAKKLL